MPSARSSPPGQPVFQLRVHLEDVEPEVWRRVLVPGSVRLATLHSIIQAAMGWTDSHLHAFRVGEQRFGMRYDDWDDDEIDENEVTVLQALRGQPGFPDRPRAGRPPLSRRGGPDGAAHKESRPA